MKAKLLMLGLLVSGSLMAAPIDDVKKSFEGSHIQKSDWKQVKKADYQQANNADKYRIINVKLGPKEAMVKIDFTELEKDVIGTAEGYCWRLAALTPIERPKDWSSTTLDETALSQIYTGPLENGDTRKGVIKGWEFVRYRMENTIYCSVKEGA